MTRQPAALIAGAIDHLVAHYQDQPDLAELADRAGMSPFHFQKVFKRWVGISPKRFCQFVTLGHARTLLRGDVPVLDAALEVGLSGPSRLHDLFVACEAMTPGEYKALGAALTVRWGFADLPFGRALIAATARGICWLGFVAGEDTAPTTAEFTADWQRAERVRDDAVAERMAGRLLATLDGRADGPLSLHLRGTNFQLKVWEALLRIPPGRLVSYGGIARAIGRPEASRAVGTAVGANPISFIVPCHRVVLGSGVIHNYRWGTDRKRALIAWECGRAESGRPIAA